MSLHTHLNALDEAINRARMIRTAASNSVEALIGPTPVDPAGRAGSEPNPSGLTGQFQNRIEELFTVLGQIDSLVNITNDYLIDSGKKSSSLMPETTGRGGY